MRYVIQIREYLGYRGGHPEYGKSRQVTVETEKSMEELRERLAELLMAETRKAGRPRKNVSEKDNMKLKEKA